MLAWLVTGSDGRSLLEAFLHGAAVATAAHPQPSLTRVRQASVDVTSFTSHGPQPEYWRPRPFRRPHPFWRGLRPCDRIWLQHCRLRLFHSALRELSGFCRCHPSRVRGPNPSTGGPVLSGGPILSGVGFGLVTGSGFNTVVSYRALLRLPYPTYVSDF